MTSVEEYMRLGRRAQKVVRKLLIRGVLPSPNSLKCFDCGVSAEVWEHRDYRLPDEVEPVCRRCKTIHYYAVVIDSGVRVDDVIGT